MVRRTGVVLVTVVLLVLGVRPRRGSTCGPSFDMAFFHFQRHPDLDLQRFARGDLGVLLPTYARSYLAIAYRNLGGRPLTREERLEAVSLWEDRLDLVPFGSRVDVLDRWQDARERVVHARGPAVEQFRQPPSSFASYLNCPDAVLDSAATVLLDRAAVWGAASPWTLDWLRAQDLVLANCGGGARLPEPAPPGAPALLRQDRAYQTAAAYFYAEAYDLAAVGFDAVARDPESPWHGIAPYLTARVMARKGLLTGEKAMLGLARLRLRGVPDDPAWRLGGDVAALDDLLAARENPHRQLIVLARRLYAGSPQVNDFRRWLDDYTLLLEDAVSAGGPALTALRASDDMTDWILSFQEGAADHAFARWQTTRSDAWLLAALTRAQRGDPVLRLSALLAAAAQVAPGSPAFATASFQRVRLLTALGRLSEARALSDAGLAADVPGGARDLLAAQRLGLATSIDDLARHLPREPVGVSDDFTPAEVAPPPRDQPGALLEPRGAHILAHGLPLSALEQLSARTTLPAPLRRAITQAAWVRAVLLADDATGLRLARDLAAQAPDLAADLARYAAGENAEQRAFQAALVILRHPGMRPTPDPGLPRREPLASIDSFRDNWWCADPTGAHTLPPDPTQPLLDLSGPPAPPAPAGFLTAGERTALARERSALRKLAAAPDHLTRAVLAYHKHNPRDPEVPEALHLAVRATRYGCSDETTTELSCAAFRTLHRKYPRSPWVARTPYCF